MTRTPIVNSAAGSALLIVAQVAMVSVITSLYSVERMTDNPYIQGADAPQSTADIADWNPFSRHVVSGDFEEVDALNFDEFPPMVRIVPHHNPHSN